MPTAVLTRDFTVDQKAVNTEARTVKLAFSSEYPVLRRDKSGTEYWEILDHSSDDGVDFSRMKGAPFLLNHNFDQQIGGIREWKLNTIERVARAKAQLFDDPQSDQMLRAIDSELRPNVSVGYTHLSYKTRGKDKDGVEIRVYKWAPYEISSVAVPQDPGVGVGRSLELPTPEQEANKQQPEPMSKENQDPPASKQEPANQNRGGEAPNIITPQFSQSDLRSAEKKRQKEIAAYGEKFGVKREKVEEAIDNDVDASEFLRSVANEWEAPDENLNLDRLNDDVGLNKRELEEYDIAKCIQDIRRFGNVQGMEREASEQAAANINHTLGRGEFLVPAEVGRPSSESIERRQMRRDMDTATATNLGYMVQNEPAGYIEKLENANILGQLGFQMVDGVTGDLPMNKKTGNTTGYWLGETESATESDISAGQIWLRPKRLVIRSVQSDQVLIQTGGLSKRLIEDDMAEQEALAVQLAALNGSGAGANPLGINKQTGIGSVTFGAAPTYAKWLSFWKEVHTDNANLGSLAFVTNTNSIYAGLTIPRFSSTDSRTIIEADLAGSFRFNGIPVLNTNQAFDIADQVLFGSWAQAIWARWQTRRIVVDEYTKLQTGQFVVQQSSFHDTNVRHVESFAVSADGGNQ